MSDTKICVGIDLGTSNSAIATSESVDESPQIVEIPQASANSLSPSKTLPSVLFVSGAEEKVAVLPWEKEPAAIVVGQWARERGAQVPDRVITSAKSWLCSPAVDRRGAILPWKSETVTDKISPVESSRRLLEHLKAALEQNLIAKNLKLEDCRVVVTVPASFDEVARELTREAASAAGLNNVTLLEEPQAAFYAWIAQSGGEWRRQVKSGDVVLVVDVGGGTTDFSLISVSQENGDLHLERISVGEHLLLGGDNMDLALAYQLKNQLETNGQPIDAWQLGSLVHSARLGKERLLGDEALIEFPISVPSRGSKLFARTIATKLSRTQVMASALEGFFPMTASDAMPANRRSVGLQEAGLNFVSDPAISRHLARFLKRSLENARSDEKLAQTLKASGALSDTETFLRPTAVLFNGGVFVSPVLRARVMELLESWLPKEKTQGPSIRELAGADFELAVARGAAFYASVAQAGKGVRIKAGTARSYYLGLESSQPAIPGYEPPIKGLCVVPQGVEEGSELALEGRDFGLVTGEPVEFRFFSSSVRAGDGVGQLVDDASRDLEETASLKVVLPAIDNRIGEVVPVQLQSVVTEVGTLELWMKHTQSNQKWNLEFNVRPDR